MTAIKIIRGFCSRDAVLKLETEIEVFLATLPKEWKTKITPCYCGKDRVLVFIEYVFAQEEKKEG